ncbi:hypothetical protein GQ43DRAFT_78765 [Delitschia confertaspora ATCC 74209]|uniref:Uncharacterized protein n=1 Tax=Delitschia confertaspora ATCC 74209 TaxID=1513339 RepID=A0A9P4JNG1_9PLEO|nr:hypothetical protein GQ43DRAFT_78765 [Delitschia confertaspora ATCC 74209]
MLLFGYARSPWCYHTPRDIQSFVDVISFCAYSRLTNSKEFRIQFDIQNPADQETHFVSKVHAAKHRYLFGFYMGKDGRRHMGFDIAQRGEGVSAERIDVVDPGIFLDHGSLLDLAPSSILTSSGGGLRERKSYRLTKD